MQAVIYARYSSHNQTEQSIEGQLQAGAKYAAENGFTVVNHYIDRAKTGTNDNRAAFQQMLRDSEKRLFDAVIVWKIDRFGRNREEIAINRHRLRKNGVKICYTEEHIPDTPEGVILESVLEGFAEYYSKNLAQNVKRGMAVNAVECHNNGSVRSFGYGIAEDKSFYLIEEEAAAARKAFEMFAAGETQQSVIQYLNAAGWRTPSGSRFSHGSVRRMLTNRKYMGEYRWGDVIVPDGLPRVVDDETFAQCQKRFKTTAPRRCEQKEYFLLTGKLFCGSCGGPMSGDSGTSKQGRTYHYYTCSAKKHRRGCKKKSITKYSTEKLVLERTISNLYDDELISMIAEKVVQLQAEELRDKSKLQYLQSRLHETETAINNIIKAIEAGIFTPATKGRLDELEAEKKEIEDDIAVEEFDRPTLTPEQVIFFLKSLRNGSVDDRVYQQKLIDTFVNSIYVYDDKMIISYNYAAGSELAAKEYVDLVASGKSSDEFLLGVPSRTHPNPIFIGQGFFSMEIPLHM